MDPTTAPPEEAQAAATFDLFDLPEEYYDSPYRWFRLLRDYDPMHRNSDGTVLLTRYGDVREVWRDPSASVDKTDLFREKFGEGPLFEHHTSVMVFRDPPDHSRLRALANPFFAPASVKRFRPFVEALVDRLLDEAAERGEVEFVADFASQVPVAVITRILGVPPEDGDYIRRLGQRVLFPLNPRVSADAVASGHAAVAEFLAYLRDQVDGAGGSAHETPTLIEALRAAQRKGEELSEDELLHMCLLMLNGGHETTTNLIAVGTLALLRQRSEYEALGECSDEMVSPAVEECFRFVTPLQFQNRRMTKDLEVPSGKLSKGTDVILCQASANRDERAFDRPDRLDLSRRPNAHLAFGLGVHVCVGRPLARLEAAIVLERLARRFPGLELAGEPEFNRNARFRSLRTLPVRVA